MTENGVIRVRSRRFLAQMNGTGPKLNFGLFSFSFVFPYRIIPTFSPYFSYLFPPKNTPNRVPLILLVTTTAAANGRDETRSRRGAQGGSPPAAKGDISPTAKEAALKAQAASPPSCYRVFP